MKFTTEDCKEFIKNNVSKYNIPLDGWKRKSKIKNKDGNIRLFEHKDGFLIEILENNTLSIISCNKKIEEKIFSDENFNELPKNVKLFINTLRSLQGDFPLFENEFNVNYQNLWSETIKERHSKSNSGLPDIFLFSSENADKIWDILYDSIDDSFNNEHIIKYIAKYFWFAFVNDPRDEDEPEDVNPKIIITPKGFWDDGRIPMIFNINKIQIPLLKGLEENGESTIEMKINEKDPLVKLRIAYQKMKEIGIEFSENLQGTQEKNYPGMKDFINDYWIKENLEDKENIIKIKIK